MRCAVEQGCEQAPDLTDEEHRGQQIDVDAFALHVACAPEQRDPVTHQQARQEPVLAGHRRVHRYGADDRFGADRHVRERNGDHDDAEQCEKCLKSLSHGPLPGAAELIYYALWFPTALLPSPANP
jgi:hypothetical protein